MSWIVENWYVFVGLLAVLACLFFVRLAAVQEWLLGVVVEAEKELGGGTGQLKLRQAYDKFLERFSWLAVLLPFSVFSNMVDKALDKMRKMLEQNKAAKAYVEGE